MSLTKDDLQAVKQLIDSSIDERVPPMLDRIEDRTFKRLTRLEARLIERIDDTDESLARQTAAGFAEVHQKIDETHARLGRIERNQQVDTKRAKLKRISKTA